ncbi:MAG: exonuclease domain-containing protein [Burkholderiaceae bacterium]
MEPIDFAPRIAFVDVETTGASPHGARVTEVGVVTVTFEAPGEPPRVEEWSSLVNPGVPIPPEIRFLTGITDDMVAAAPRFAELAPGLLARLEGAVFVAHMARFDYGFVKREFARAGVEFHARTLCTVRLSRLLDPQRSPHTLDAIIARHRLPVTDRHRALGDARVLWAFLQSLYRRLPKPQVDDALRRLLRHPNLPAHLPPDTLERLPAAPGVYAFYGLNEHPLYIGKSLNLRDRVAAHFCGDHTSERGLRLAAETRSVQWQETAGDFGARLLETRWIRERRPAHNVALRERAGAVFVEIDPASALPRYVPAARADLDAPAAVLHGPFASRASARRALADVAASAGLCTAAMRLERTRAGEPCFRRQLGRCAGACVGAEPRAALACRVLEALAPLRLPPWPRAGAIALVERDPARLREDWHVFDRWRWLGTVGSETAAIGLARERARRLGDAPAPAAGESPARSSDAASAHPDFDDARYRLLRAALARAGDTRGARIATLEEVSLELHHN